MIAEMYETISVYEPIHGKHQFFVLSFRIVKRCGRMLNHFTGLVRAKTVAAKCNLLTERTGLVKSESVAFSVNGT